MMSWQTIPTGSRADAHRPLPQRIDAWHRDASSSAFAIARWEDDGGLVDSLRIRPDRPLSTNGRMVPHGSREI